MGDTFIDHATADGTERIIMSRRPKMKRNVGSIMPGGTLCWLDLMQLPPDPLSIYQQPRLRYHQSPGTPFDLSVPRYKALGQTNSSSALRNPESLEQFSVSTELYKLYDSRK